MKLLQTTFLTTILAFFTSTLFSQNVARIGDKYYTSLKTAVEAAKDGDEIVLTDNTDITEAMTFKKNITLNLSTYTITNKSTKEGNILTISPDFSLTIKGEGAIVCNNDKVKCNLIYNLGTLNLEGGKISSCLSESGTIKNYSGTLNMTGGTIENTQLEIDDFAINYTRTSNALHISVDGNATITGGTIKSNYTAIFNANSRTSNAKVNIDDKARIEGYLYATYASKFTSLPSRYLVFTPNDSDNDNVVKNILKTKTCSNLVLTDGYTFKSPLTFTATASSYSRTMSNEWGTLCLPFSIDLENSDVECYAITAVSDNKLTLSKYATNIEAGTPVIIRKKDALQNEITIRGIANSSVCTQPTSPQTSDANLFGVFEQQNLLNTASQNYYFIANNMFYNAARETSVAPYRAFFTLNTTNINSPQWQPSQSFSINTSEHNITSAKSITDAIADNLTIKAIHTPTGTKINRLTKGINIVTLSNGRTIKITIK